MWGRLIGNVRLFFLLLFHGMKSADKMILSNDTDKDDDIGGVEEKQEVKSVLNDLLKGEVTQEVIELRHEMYFSERESKKYQYKGNGRAVKRNSIFSYSGNIDMSDGLPLLLVQDNKVDVGTLADQGIHLVKNEASGNMDVVLDDKAKNNKMFKPDYKYTVTIDRDFIPNHYLEKYLSRVVVKMMDEETNGVLVDMYVPKYKRQFDNVQKMFVTQMEKIYNGNFRNQLLEFNELSFVTSNAYGCDDYVTFRFNMFHLDNVLLHDGFYVLRYSAHLKERSDALDEIYDSQTAEKCEKKEKRDKHGATMGSESFLVKAAEETVDYDKAVGLMQQLKGKKNSDEEK